MEKQKITGSEALLKSLIAEGVDTIFGYPGGQAIPIYDSLYDYRDKLKHVLVRHEDVYKRQELYFVVFLAWGCDFGLSRFTAVQFTLDKCRI